MSEQENERKNKTISGVVTTVITILLFLLFWWYTLDYDVPPLVEEAEVEVELIPSGGGGGSSSAPTTEQTVVPKISIPAQSTEQTRDQEAVAQKKTSTTPNDSKNTNSNDDFNPASKYSKTSSTTGTSTSTQPDFGGSGGGSGGGNGTKTGTATGDGGMQHSFGNRKISGPKITHDCQIRGKIIVEVSVAQDGSITILNTDPGSTQNTCLENKAKSLIRSSHFEASTRPGSATGFITINFDLS
jgi:outer membrane biosynthesis protein TonB